MLQNDSTQLHCYVYEQQGLPSISQVGDDRVSIRDLYHTMIEPTLDTTQRPSILNSRSPNQPPTCMLLPEGEGPETNNQFGVAL